MVPPEAQVLSMMAIGNAMGIHPGMVAGAVICGAMFGDKLSPLPIPQTFAPAVADAKLGRSYPLDALDHPSNIGV